MRVPPEGRDAEQAIDVAPVRPFHGSVWRAHWRNVPAADAGLSLRTSGRYHRGLDLFPLEQVWAALYTSLAPEISIWEMVRRSAARDVTYLRNNVLTELEVELDSVLNLLDPARVRLTREELTAPDHRLCQSLAAVAVVRGYQGLLVPSAALPGSNLVILPRNLPNPPPIRIVSSTELPLDAIAQARPDR